LILNFERNIIKFFLGFILIKEFYYYGVSSNSRNSSNLNFFIIHKKISKKN
jgi:hypothetical protein